MIDKIKEAVESSNDVLIAYTAYLKSITKARKKYEQLAKDMEKIIAMPAIDLDTFEIDG